MTDDAPHDDACRCMACCAERFKTIDPATFGNAPEMLGLRPCNHTLYNARCSPAITKEPP